MSFPLREVRAEFPLLERTLGGEPLLYLDCASTAPRCRAAIAAVRRFQESETANVHRGVHALAAEASAAFEAARHSVARHLDASAGEIVFTSGTTHAINLVAQGSRFAPDSEVVITGVEHHANLLPWRAHARVVVVPSDADGVPRWDELEACITSRTRLVAVHHASNVLGTIAPLARIGELARRHRVPWLVDGAQGAGHLPVDVAGLGCDYYAFSAHKLGGPSGVGALYVRRARLDALAKSTFGGGMVALVDGEGHEVRDGVAGFEPGTPNVEGVLGMAAALEFLRGLGMERIEAHGRTLAAALVDAVTRIPGVRVLGGATERIPVVSLALPDSGLDAETVARTLSDSSGILVSAGRHCAHPLHAALGVAASLRASAWIVHDEHDIERFASALRGLLA